MIDHNGYRPNVGIVICNKKGQVLWARRYGKNSWQFPQGGINPEETYEQAMYRELFEEVGLKRQDVTIIASTRYWLRYTLPKHFIRWYKKPTCIGQKQRWFLLQLICDDSVINMHSIITPEFDNWCWVSFWYPVRQIVSFKRDVYSQVMKEFSPFLILLRDINLTKKNIYIK
ncbi:RNA pyrophosphohydrolase [Candidatus Profftia lariciata]|uniref:RNA pyrophosphohydrolase n=1 Tax=Candidatus Profftia lariciata TaxID=1987921 RepID=UPI001D020DD9|nr:RNA pyrophosphohydrolase [Candidatus Profftia lariciata]UDG81470.1 RNA pyrophosphohydrolase [Candidatus Profftia lariciata]